METDDLKKKSKINKILIGVLLVVLLIILLVILIKCFRVKNSVNNNDSNMGMVISGDDYIFYYKYNSGVIKIKDGKEYQISDDGAYAIQYANDYIYYTTPNISGGIDIKKVSQNGDTNVVLTSVASASTKMYLEDGYLYYTTTNPDTISKIDINGENESVVLTRTIYDFKVLDSTIYFTDSSEHLYKIDTNGENYEELSSNPLAKRFQIVKNGVYYFDADVSKLLKFDLDSKQISEVTDKLNCDIYNVTSDGIYYLDSENLKICFVDLNNKNSKEIVTVSTANTKLNIQGTILYYLDITEAGDYIAKRISTTGKSLDEIKY